MDLDARLYRMAKLLLRQDDEDAVVELLFRHLAEATGAERGFVVVREGDSFEQRHDLGFAAATVSSEESRFSRSLVRRALETREIIHSPNLAADSRFAGAASLAGLDAGEVLVAPLHHDDVSYGAVYLVYPHGVRADRDDTRAFLVEFCELAGLSIHRAIEREALRRRNRSLETDLFAQNDFQGIVTRDPKMIALLEVVAQVADSTATVLVRGETGTGKDLIARALHLNSARRERPFVPLHVGALSPAMLESELFGHVRGAFTGAERERAGRVASAHRGTLFLDEIAEISPEVQVKLLRLLQFGELNRVGSDATEKVDVRVVAATHRDLDALVRAGRFRQDLYFRLNVVELVVSPLRERPGDIPLLFEHFLARSWRKRGARPRPTPRLERALRAYAFPGNVRELTHLVERACLLATGPELDVELFPPLAATREAGAASAADGGRFRDYTGAELTAARDAAVAEVEREFVRGRLERSDGNVSRAAREAGIPRSYLQKLLARHR